MVVVLGSILILRLHAFLALLLGAVIVAWLTPESNLEQYGVSAGMAASEIRALAGQPIGQRLANGFGNTCAGIGLLIALASIIGKALLDSGAADRIVRSGLRLLGEKRAPLAFLGSGFVLGVPVFFDTVFYLLVPLAKALGARNERNYLLYILTIVAGTTMAHSLVPPTPGPLFVAGELNVDVGTMMLGGVMVGIFTSTAGYLYAQWANRRWPVPIRETGEVSLSELKAFSVKEDRELPPFWLSILPIVLPVVLIAGRTIISMTAAPSASQIAWLTNLGDSNIAMTIAAMVALGMLLYQKGSNRKELAAAMQNALSSAGIIILITASGGAFGKVLQQTGIGPEIQKLATAGQLAVLPLAFFVTALVRTAQGSATVAMITAVGILAGFADSATLGFHPVYLALAIGCGSKPFPWMNDSGFWIISRMSGFTEVETLKTFSVMLTSMGVVGLVVVMMLARLFPMI
jgi:GntP family gluconate:H+ symporter